MKAAQLKGGSFVQPEAGTQTVTVVKVIDLGTQPADVIKGGQYAGKPIAAGPKVLFALEVVDSPQEDGSATILYKETTMALGAKSNLAALSKSFLQLSDEQFAALVTQNGGFVPDQLLGKSALSSITHSPKDDQGHYRARVGTFQSLLKGQVPTTAKTKLAFYDVENPDAEIYNSLPDFIKAKIDQSLESPQAGSLKDSSVSVSSGSLDL